MRLHSGVQYPAFGGLHNRALRVGKPSFSRLGPGAHKRECVGLCSGTERHQSAVMHAKTNAASPDMSQRVLAMALTRSFGLAGHE